MDEYGRVVEICEREYLALDFRDVELLDYLLSRNIKENGFQPTGIVGIGRWGNETANRLSMYLDLDRALSVAYKRYGDGIGKASKARCYQGLAASIRGQRVIVADEIADGGHTLRIAVDEQIRPGKPVEVKTAAPIIKLKTNPRPDFWVMETDKWVLLQRKMFSNILDLLYEYAERFGIEAVISKISDPANGLGYPDYVTSEALSTFRKNKTR